MQYWFCKLSLCGSVGGDCYICSWFFIFYEFWVLNSESWVLSSEFQYRTATYNSALITRNFLSINGAKVQKKTIATLFLQS